MTTATRGWTWMVAVAAGAALLACGGSAGSTGSASSAGSTGSTAAAAGDGDRVRPGTGAAMCAALTASDLTAVGLQPELQKPDVNPGDPPDSGAYCSFTKASGASGGIEFDIFYPADHSVYQTVVSDGGGTVRPASMSGIDEGSFVDMGKWAGIDVRRGTLVFAISVPSGSRSHDQLVTLTQDVLGRAG